MGIRATLVARRETAAHQWLAATHTGTPEDVRRARRALARADLALDIITLNGIL